MSLFKRKADAPEEAKRDIEYVVKGEVRPFNRQLRKLFEKELDKSFGKFGDLVHPETGERPRFVFNQPGNNPAGTQIRLVTDSQPLRDWLREKGLPIEGEIVDGQVVEATPGLASSMVEDAVRG